VYAPSMPQHALDRPISDLKFTVEVWDNRDSMIVEVLAAARNSRVANVAYEAALETRPNAIVNRAEGARARRADTRPVASTKAPSRPLKKSLAATH